MRLRGREGLLLGRGKRKGDGLLGVYPRISSLFFFVFFFFFFFFFCFSSCFGSFVGPRDCPGDPARGLWDAARCRDGRAREGVSAETEMRGGGERREVFNV